MPTLPLIISDETLRDGEQQAGLFFPYETKKTLANLISQTGVHQIALMPAVHETEEHLLKTLIAEGNGSIMTASTMVGKQFIDLAKACGVERIILFYAVSDRLLLLRDTEIRNLITLPEEIKDNNLPNELVRRVRENMINKLLENLCYATSPEIGLKVEFAAEDASRADFNFLVECIRSFQPYIEHFVLCDTMGILTPEKTYIWVRDLLELTNNAALGVHFHNDLGMALENTLQAVIAGASMISGTFLGIGERAGNIPLEQVLNGLRWRFGIEVEGINYQALSQVTNYLDSLGVRPAPPYSQAALRHESGIHVNGFLRDPDSYHIFPHALPEIWFGKCSGASNFQYLFEKQLNQPLSPQEYNRMRDKIKFFSIQEQRCFSPEEIISLFQQGFFND
ncbi:2-isopropylmalate synthase [Planktothrix sp. FACHB-1365]|uniref:2-isopropylmalate synthase n=1 Tax=Planktothrix sp. FACHB-1365 TaxID=2692855 RepID=UPI0016880971|nr:2-isopropylmalate synthase [Planktothrix sp. FACHB-1365]MBD2483964.1 2-isopropylmalate synthase [Planktothrix sp. FACHB-1365]